MPIDPPFDPPTLPPDAAFDALDAGLPLALLPLRLEVRYWYQSTPPELRVRIYPDVAHADGHQPELTATEQELGRAFWRRCWRSGPDPLKVAAPVPPNGTPVSGAAGRDAAFAWLAGQLGPWRAAWVARQMMPRNNGAAPQRPVPDGQVLIPPPLFPDLAERAPGGPTYARLLPARFALIMCDGEVQGPFWGEPVSPDIALAPGLVEAGEDLDGRALLDAQGLRWTYDFEEAVDVGMAIRVNFSQLPERYLTRGIPRLLVVGVRAGDQSTKLEELLEAHRYTHGLDLLGQGTPTNATETAAPTLCLERPDLGELRTAELGASSAKRATVQSDGDLYRIMAAEAGTLALGLTTASVLERVSNWNLLDAGHGEAMARALWPGTLGHYLDELMQTGLASANRTWLRDWSTRYVRGGALLPTLLIGAQPYGLLPVSRVEAPDDPVGRIQNLEAVLAQLRPTWDALARIAPRLDPNAGDAGPGAGDRAALVSQILGGVPHPIAFALQRVDDKRASYSDSWDFKLGLLMLSAAYAPNMDGTDPRVDSVPDPWYDGDGQVSSVLWGEWLILRDGLVAATTPDEQIEALTNFAEFQRWFVEDEAYQELDEVHDYYVLWEDFTRTQLIDFVAAHQSRTEPAAWLRDFAPDITRLMGDEDDPKAFFAYHPSRADWALPLVSEGRAAADVSELREWLDGVADDLAAGRGPDHSFGEAQPLLRQLIAWSAKRAVGGADAALMRDGLSTLISLTNTRPDPIGDLERLVRETVSTSINRLDAWYTGIAAARLENKRQARPTGIQVGAYGWLEDITPRRRRATQGYVLAPSAAHATTAAILRSGWSAFGGDAESAGLAVDLSSDRIRRARWLIAGVRNGQDLGRLLGARCERRLHDAGLAVEIEELRQLALDATDDPAPPTAIVDGLLLARARAYLEAPADERDGYTDAERAAADLLDPKLADVKGLDDVLDEVLGDLDAVADASVAQSVFSLTEGSVPEATATLSASATGEAAFPRLRFADSRRAAATITHRLALFVPAGARGTWPGAVTSGRALAAPGVEAWLEGLLGEPDGYGVNAHFADPATGAPVSPVFAHTLADTGLAALDVVCLAPTGEDAGLGRLGAVLAAWAEGLRPDGLDPAAVLVLETDAGDPSLDELAVAARALRALVGEARDLDGRDLAAPGSTDPVRGLDTDELETRLDDVAGALETGRAALAAALAAATAGAAGNGAARALTGGVRAAMLALAGFQLPAAVPREGDVVAQGETLLAAIVRRQEQYGKRVDEAAAGWPALDEVGRHRALRERAALLIGHELALAPPFTAAGGPAFGTARFTSRTAPTEWLAAAGRVDPGARRLRVALDLTEALGTAQLGFSLAQLPDHPEEGWAAVSRPARDEHGRLCVLATGAPAALDKPVAGLVIGTWTEVVPSRRRTAALGVHYDAPSSRAPQAILLCSAETETGFSFELVRDLLNQTLDLAKIRAVGPQSLGELGQFLPGTYLDNLIPAGATS
jgi:hypothetical protein